MSNVFPPTGNVIIREISADERSHRVIMKKFTHIMTTEYHIPRVVRENHKGE